MVQMRENENKIKRSKKKKRRILNSIQFGGVFFYGAAYVGSPRCGRFVYLTSHMAGGMQLKLPGAIVEEYWYWTRISLNILNFSKLFNLLSSTSLSPGSMLKSIHYRIKSFKRFRKFKESGRFKSFMIFKSCKILKTMRKVRYSRSSRDARFLRPTQN